MQTYLILMPDGKVSPRAPDAVVFREQYCGRAALKIYLGQKFKIGVDISDSEKEDTVMSPRRSLVFSRWDGECREGMSGAS